MNNLVTLRWRKLYFQTRKGGHSSMTINVITQPYNSNLYKLGVFQVLGYLVLQMGFIQTY